MIVWVKPIGRGDLRLVSGDITEALICFKHKTGQEPKLIILNAKNAHLASEASDGIKMDIVRPRGRPKTHKKRQLPEGKIKQLHSQGMGSKVIATKLKVEQGINVSYKTIQSVLLGERLERVS